MEEMKRRGRPPNKPLVENPVPVDETSKPDVPRGTTAFQAQETRKQKRWILTPDGWDLQ